MFSKLQATVISLTILLCFTFISAEFLYDIGFAIPKHHRFHKFMQTYFHGVVVNYSQRPIKITSFKQAITIPPGKSSLDMGVLDADSLIIDYPTQIDGQLYTQGDFKFCDLGALKVTDNAGIHLVALSRKTMLCKVFKDFQYYPSVDEAFSDKY